MKLKAIRLSCTCRLLARAKQIQNLYNAFLLSDHKNGALLYLPLLVRCHHVGGKIMLLRCTYEYFEVVAAIRLSCICRLLARAKQIQNLFNPFLLSDHKN